MTGVAINQTLIGGCLGRRGEGKDAARVTHPRLCAAALVCGRTAHSVE
jgi:hypothetical protein